MRISDWSSDVCSSDLAEPLKFNGEQLKAISVAVDGRVLGEGERTIDGEFLTVPDVPDAFVLETEVEIDPQANKALDGPYMSGGRRGRASCRERVGPYE